jgi:hypothetical protein
LAAKARGPLQRDDDYSAPGKPACDWTDRAAREQLVDVLVRDAYRAHHALRGERLDPRTAEAAALLATITGQDIEETSDGRFRIFEGTAPDRVISTVDPEARHGHKTAAHGFDGYKAHVAVDPDSEVICAAEVSPAATGDATVAPTLLGDLTSGQGEPAARAVVYGDGAYGTGANLTWLNQHGLTPMVRTQLPRHRAAASARTSSMLTSRPGRSPAPRGSRWRLLQPVAVVGGPGSALPAASARCGMAAPPPLGRAGLGRPGRPRKRRRAGRGRGGSGRARAAWTDPAGDGPDSAWSRSRTPHRGRSPSEQCWPGCQHLGSSAATTGIKPRSARAHIIPIG